MIDRMQALLFLAEELASSEPDFDASVVTIDADVNELGVESVTLVSAIAACEDRWDIELPDHDLFHVETVSDLFDLIDSTLACR